MPVADRLGWHPRGAADIQLHRARLFGDRQALVDAGRRIEACGYARRRGELDDAEAAMAR